MLLGQAQGSIAEQLDEAVGDLGIELLPRLLGQLARGLLEAQRVAIGASRRHRVEGIRGADDAARQRDALTCHSVRVTLAVPALVVMPDPGGDVVEAEGEHRSLPGRAVALDHRELVARSRAPA